MARPKTKSELLTATAQGYDQLNDTLGKLTAEQQQALFPFDHRDKNVRDVLAHLHEWQNLFLSWYQIGMTGSQPDMPASGYTWKTTPELNAAIWARFQNESLASVRKNLDDSHFKIIEIITSHTNTQLFTKQRYAWTGSTSLGSYLVSATSAHYIWAMKLLGRYIRVCGDEA